MKRKLEIINVDLTDNKLLLQTNESISGLTPREQILVDSEQFAFIYLMEDDSDYTYVVIHEAFWPQLNNAMNDNVPVFIYFEKEQIELTFFNEEIEYVISNIRGNSNYGEEMVTKVEKIF